MDGYELAEQIRHIPGGGGVRLFAVTGYGQTTDRKRSFESGFEHHLSKPVDLEKLDELIRKPSRPNVMNNPPAKRSCENPLSTRCRLPLRL